MFDSAGRHRFAIVAALALLAGAGFNIGCGGGGSPASPTSPAPNAPVLAPGDIAGEVSANHPAPHSVVITAAQLAAGGAVVLDLFGGMHPHTLSLTAAEVAQIARRERLQKSSSVDTHSSGLDPHSHAVTFN